MILVLIQTLLEIKNLENEIDIKNKQINLLTKNHENDLKELNLAIEMLKHKIIQLEEENNKADKNIDNQELNKEINKYMTITTIKSAKSQIEKIKNNLYYENKNKNKNEKKQNKDSNKDVKEINQTNMKKASALLQI